MKQELFDFDAPFLTQRRHDAIAGLDSVTTNNLVKRHIIEVDEIISGRGRGIRKFAPSTAWKSLMMMESVRHHKMPLGEAAEIAQVANRLARKGQFLEQWTNALSEGRRPLVIFMAVSWSDECYDAQIIFGDRDGRPNFARPDATRFLTQPFLLLPISALFEDVWRKCAAMIAADQKRKGADRDS